MEFHCTICRGQVSKKQWRQHRTCQNIQCRYAHRAKMRVAEKEALRKESEHRRRRLATAMCAVRELSDTDITPDQLYLLPSNDHAFGNLPEKRRRAFRDHLLRQIGIATSMPAGPDVADLSQSAPNPLNAAACATCRGGCCTGGNTEAYVTSETIRRFMNAHTEMRPRDVLAMYLSRLPHRSYRDSCVFHTTSGCALSREMRSNTCNDFQCDYLAAMGKRDAPVAKPVYLVAMDRSDVVNRVQKTNRSTRDRPET